MTSLTAKEIVEAAREAIFDQSPAFASLLAKQELVGDDKAITFCVDGKRLTYSPDFVEHGRMLNPPGPLTIEEVTWVLYHEMGHLFLGHHLRMFPELSMDRQNIAADLALNSLLCHQECGPSRRFLDFIVAPESGAYADLKHGLDFETYLKQLPESESKKPKQDGGTPGEGLGNVMPHPGDSEAENAQAIQQWQEMVGDAVMAEKMCGSQPGWLSELAQEAYGKVATTDWRSALRRFMTQQAPTGTSWSRPSRRQFNSPILFPCNIATGAGHGLVVVDTSGSMSADSCNVALTEIENIVHSFPNGKVTIRQCDTRVLKEGERVFEKKDFPLRAPTKWFGRGGTNMVPAFDQARDERAKWKWMILITDFYWNYQAIKPTGIPTFWVNVGGGIRKVPFGHCTAVKP